MEVEKNQWMPDEQTNVSNKYNKLWKINNKWREYST